MQMRLIASPWHSSSPSRNHKARAKSGFFHKKRERGNAVTPVEFSHENLYFPGTFFGCYREPGERERERERVRERRLCEGRVGSRSHFLSLLLSSIGVVSGRWWRRTAPRGIVPSLSLSPSTYIHTLGPSPFSRDDFRVDRLIFFSSLLPPPPFTVLTLLANLRQKCRTLFPLAGGAPRVKNSL